MAYCPFYTPPPLTTTYASVAFYALFFDKSLVSLLDNGALYAPFGQRMKIHFLHIVTFQADTMLKIGKGQCALC